MSGKSCPIESPRKQTRKKKAFIAHICEVKANLKPGDALVLQDEASVEINRRVGPVWWPRGERPSLPVGGGHERVNLMGAADLTHGGAYFAEYPRTNATSFESFLQGLTNTVPGDGKIYLVTANHRAHHAKALEPFLAEVASRLKLEYLPPYSPDLNPMENVWECLKAGVVESAYFEDSVKARASINAHIVPLAAPGAVVPGAWDITTWTPHPKYI